MISEECTQQVVVLFSECFDSEKRLGVLGRTSDLEVACLSPVGARNANHFWGLFDQVLFSVVESLLIAIYCTEMQSTAFTGFTRLLIKLPNIYNMQVTNETCNIYMYT